MGIIWPSRYEYGEVHLARASTPSPALLEFSLPLVARIRVCLSHSAIFGVKPTADNGVPVFGARFDSILRCATVLFEFLCSYPARLDSALEFGQAKFNTSAATLPAIIAVINFDS